MRYIILHILCEGQTEERFVKEVLSPYLQQFNIFPKPILLLTSRRKNAHGGMLSYLQAKRDLNIIRRQCRDNDSEHHVITTMFDYYALPADFPGFQKSRNINDVRARVALIEEEMSNDMGVGGFIPYVQLHEFESLLFADITQLEAEYPLSKPQIRRLKEETDCFGDPELINNSVETAPSRRIIKALGEHYHYNKVQSGCTVASRIGIEKLMYRCRHFNDWVSRILNCDLK